MKLTNGAYDERNDRPLDFCGLAILEAGSNLPCLSPAKDLSLNMSQEYKEGDDG